MSPTIPVPIAGLLAGAASIALRFAGFEQYQKAAELYRKALGDPNTDPVPVGSKSYSIVISKDMELLCVWQSQALETDCTIVYWMVGETHEAIVAACQALQAQGYEMLEEPGSSPLGSRDKKNTERAVLQDKSGHRIGVIINPPVPFVGGRMEITEPIFEILPTHAINPPVTVGSTNDGS